MFTCFCVSLVLFFFYIVKMDKVISINDRILGIINAMSLKIVSWIISWMGPSLKLNNNVYRWPMNIKPTDYRKWVSFNLIPFQNYPITFS